MEEIIELPEVTEPRLRHGMLVFDGGLVRKPEWGIPEEVKPAMATPPGPYTFTNDSSIRVPITDLNENGKG